MRLKIRFLGGSVPGAPAHGLGGIAGTGQRTKTRASRTWRTRHDVVEGNRSHRRAERGQSFKGGAAEPAG